MDGLAPEWRFNGPGQKLKSARTTRMSIRPLYLRLQNKVRPLLNITFFYNSSKLLRSVPKGGGYQGHQNGGLNMFFLNNKFSIVIQIHMSETQLLAHAKHNHESNTHKVYVTLQLGHLSIESALGG